MTAMTTSSPTTVDLVVAEAPAPAAALRWSATHRALLADLTGGMVAVAAAMALGVLQSPGIAVAIVVVWIPLLRTPLAHAAGTELRRVLVGGLQLSLLCWIAPVVLEVSATVEELAVLTGLMVAGTAAARAIEHLPGLVGPASSVVLAGPAHAVRRDLAEIRRHQPRWRVVGACVDEGPGASDLGVPVAGPEQLVAMAATAQIVVATPSAALDPAALRRLSWQLEATGTLLYVDTGLVDVATSRTTVLRAGGLGLVGVRHRPGRGPARCAKAAVERTLCALALVVLLPLLLALAVAVRRDSAGPALFRQVRVGRDGRPFTMYKFRTMQVDAEAVRDGLATRNESEGGVLFKMRADPRVTRIGVVLRRYSLDELPQLLNVVLGSMSLIGPRPALPAEVSCYGDDSRRRLAVKPGLTGLWQVSGRSDLSWEESVRLDVAYVDNWSLALDARIVLRTARAVLAHRGAY